jgi:4a-hydroxytetrahydrobiopterin dehydratase
MSSLSTQQCGDLPVNDPVLDDENISRLLNELDPTWQLNAQEKTISHTYSFENYYQTMAFVNVIALVAHQQDHHPELQISYNRCTVSYSTHSAGGLSMKDFICAAKINAAEKL